MRFVDTNVLLYAASPAPNEGRKRAAALDLLKAPDIALSVQVLQEFYHQATRTTRQGSITRAKALEFIETINHLPVQEVSLDVFRAAVALSQRFQLSYWDGAILAAAHTLGCDVVCTEDLSHGQLYAGMRVVNPFLQDAQSE